MSSTLPIVYDPTRDYGDKVVPSSRVASSSSHSKSATAAHCS
jgi:hypothetical protein